MDFLSWADGFPGLLWEIEHRRSRLTLFNNWKLPLLGDDTARLIKDARFRHDSIVEPDVPLLVEFWDMMTARQPAAVSFRLKEDPGLSWLLQGWPAHHDPDRYHGMLKESVLPAAFVTNGAAETCQLALSQAQYPVFVLSLSLKQIVTCNKAASDLFSSISKRKFNLRSIAPGNLEQPLMEASHFALQNKVWAGTLVLKSGSGGFLSSKVRISPCASGSDIVRIALLNIPEAPSEHLCRQPVVENIPFSLREELQKLLSMCNGVDGLMFSDIQSARGRVEVYGVGEIFCSLPWGDGHAYEGTIAQDIERFGLESLTVEDTLDSIKSIDWAMFIPCGVRSYFALPFYNAEGLHAVLILASKTAGAFGSESEYQYSFLIDPFAKAIAQWRSLGEQKTK